MNKGNDLQQTTECKRKIPRPTRHTATLIQVYVNPTGAFPQAITQKPNKRKEKGSCNFPLRVVPQHDRFRARPSRLSWARWLASPGARTLASFSQAPTLVRLSSTDSLVCLRSSTDRFVRLPSLSLVLSLRASSSNSLKFVFDVLSHVPPTYSPKYSHRKNSLPYFAPCPLLDA